MPTTARRHVPDGYLTIDEAAVLLDVVPMTIHRMCKRGQLTKYKDRRNQYNVLIEAGQVYKLLDEPPLVVS